MGERQLNVPVEPVDGDGRKIILFDIIKWRSKGRGIVNQKTGYVISFVPAGIEPKMSKVEILRLINSGQLPAEAEWSQVKFRTSAVKKPTLIAWGFFKDAIGRKHHGFYRPAASRVTMMKGCGKSIGDLFNE